MSTRTVARSGIRRSRARALLALVLLAAACLTETTGPQPGLATFIRDLAGNAQQGTVGAPLAQPIGVTVVDLNGDPVQGVTVQWTTQHGVVLPQNGGATDAAGIARAVWTLGTAAGEQVASAAVPAVGSAQFIVQALADRPARVIALPDTLRFAALASVVPIDVTVTDRFDNVIVAPAVTMTVLDTVIARVTAASAIESRANGVTSVEVRADTAVTLVRILVQQLSAGVVIESGDIVLQAIADTARMSANALDANGHPVPVATIVWRSLAPAIATIDDSGLVRALATGSTAIVAEVPGAADTVFVRVDQAATQLTMMSDRSTVNALGDTALFTAAVTDRNGFAVDSAAVMWQSLDPSVVNVAAPGIGVALAPGTARIVAHSGAVADTAVIDVVQIPATVSITNAPDTLFTGDLLQLNAAAADSNGAAIAAPQITWSTGGGAVTVSPTGILTAAAPGTALVTATAAAAVDTVQVVIVDPENGGVVIVTVSPDGAALNAFGDTVRLSATVTEDGVPTGAPVAWIALDGAAVVDVDGLVTASANGTARIVASSGGAADTVLITVLQVTATLALTPALDTLSEGAVVVLSAVAADSNGFAIVNPVIAWSSSDEEIAAVDDNGQVTGAALGTAMITAVSDGVVADATVVVVADLYALLRRSDFEQTGTAGETLLDALLIQAYDTHEMVVPGVVVTWSIVSGGGSLSEESTTTDASGYASVSWTLGPEVGTQVARASADGVDPVDFLAIATAPPGGTRTWTGGDAAGPTDWSNANNWSPAAVPTASDSVIIGAQPNQPVLTARAEAASIAVGREPGFGATLTLAGHTLEVFGDFSTERSNGLLVMRNALDSLLVHGDADFAGRQALDSLTAGVIRLRGDFRQTYIGGNWGSFAASGAHKVILDGASAQSVTFVNPTGAPGQRSFFRHVEIANTAGGVSFDSEAFVEGDLVVTTATTIAGAGPLRVLGSITTVAGSSIAPGSIQVNGAMAVSGSFSPGTTMLGGSAQTMQPGLGYQAVQVLGRVHLGGRTNANSVRVLGPGSTIDLNGHTFEVAGDFSTEGSHGLLVMRNALDSLLVTGDAVFAGRAALDSLTAGVIRLNGDFRQAYIGGNWGSFAASGTHRVVMFDENPKTIHFDNPAGAPTQRSFFQDLELDNAGGDLTFSSAAVVTGRMTENAEGTHAIAGTGGALTVGEPQVHDFGFRNLPLVVNGIGEIGLRHVFFADMSTSATQLTVVHPGAATAFVLDSVAFMTLADADPGRYVFADDADNAAPALALLLGPDPGNGALKTGTDGVAQVTWTGAPAGGLTRTWVGGDAGGPSDWDWFNPVNWSPAGVPGEADTVVIGAVPMAPVLNGTARVARVHITGILTLGEAALVADVLNEGTLSTNPATTNSIAGNIDNRGPIIVVGSLAVLNSGRTFNTTAGNINVFGASDTLTVAGGTIRTGSGSEMLGSGLVLVIDSATLVLESDFSTGEPEWETVDVTVEGPGMLSVAGQLSTYGGTFDTDVVVNGSFDIEDGTTTINGTLANRVDGSLQIDADNDTTLLILPAGLTNEGYFSMDGSSGARSMLRLLSGTLVNAPGATIEIESDATIDAPLDNRGLLLITDTLLLQNEGRTFNMTAGVLTLEQDGALEVNGGTVRVGEDGGLLRFNGQGFPIRLLGAVNLIAETDFTWDDDGPQWHFTGTVAVDGPGMFINRSEVILTGDVINAHLRNTGVLTVGAGDTSRINGTFENFGDDGNGFFIDATDGPAAVVVAAGFTNEGAIALRGTGATLAMSAGVLVNTGSVEVGSGAATVIGEIDNQNRIASRGDLVIARSGANHVSSGTIELENGTVTFGGASLTSTETGNVFGPGTLDVSGLDFTNAGHITPGFGTRLITIEGALTDAATASLTSWIGGPPAQPELSDRIVVTGSAALAGTLNVELFGYTPVVGDSWTILTAQSVTGTFTTVNLPVLAGGLEFVVTYSATSVVLTVAPPP